MTHGFPRQTCSLLVSASHTFLPSVPSLLWFPSLGHGIGREKDEEVLDLDTMQVTRSAPRSEYSVFKHTVRIQAVFHIKNEYY